LVTIRYSIHFYNKEKGEKTHNMTNEGYSRLLSFVKVWLKAFVRIVNDVPEKFVNFSR